MAKGANRQPLRGQWLGAGSLRPFVTSKKEGSHRILPLVCLINTRHDTLTFSSVADTIVWGKP